MRWTPHVTVATVLEQGGKFLLVEEEIDRQRVLNQPAGHWEDGESLIEASIRETLEETAWLYKPESVIGIYQWQQPDKKETFLRFCFTGQLLEFNEQQELDKEIIQTVWLTYNELMNRSTEYRSPLVKTCIDDYRSGQRFDLSILKRLES